jgi:hypothetical protein
MVVMMMWAHFADALMVPAGSTSGWSHTASGTHGLDNASASQAGRCHAARCRRRVPFVNDEINGHLALETTDISVTEIIAQFVNLKNKPSAWKKIWKYSNNPLIGKITKIQGVEWTWLICDLVADMKIYQILVEKISINKYWTNVNLTVKLSGLSNFILNLYSPLLVVHENTLQRVQQSLHSAK